MEDNFVEADDNFIGSKYHEDTFKAVRLPKYIREYVVIESSGNKIPGFLKTLNDVLDSIPPEFKDSAVIKLDIEGDYDGDEAVMFVEFLQPETDEEVSKRLYAQQAKEDDEVKRALKLLNKQGYKVIK